MTPEEHMKMVLKNIQERIDKLIYVYPYESELENLRALEKMISDKLAESE